MQNNLIYLKATSYLHRKKKLSMFQAFVPKLRTCVVVPRLILCYKAIVTR